MNKLVFSCLANHYHIDVESLTILPIGADRNATLYKAQTRNASYFVKIKQGHQDDISVNIVELLSEAGLQETILPIKTIDSQITQRMGDFTVIVYPYIIGQDGFKRDLTDDQWIRLGKAKKQVHEIDVPPPIQKRLRRESYSPKWREAVRSLYPRLESEPAGDDVARQLLKLMQAQVKSIHRLVNGAEELAQKLQDHPHVLCHSDLHAGNIFIDEKGAFYIVDWDEPIMAPKERDLMIIGGGVGNVWNKPYEEKLFYQGYGKTQMDRTLLAYYRHERIVEDIAIYGQELILKSPGGQDRWEMYQHFADMFKPQGVVEIAFKT
ncbi:MAG: aminoglycoside phosphotransferase family protein [Parachlamydia sp.]|nr:aminoglycoside phosphotransferase family protein [Parachlamydia sp.]